MPDFPPSSIIPENVDTKSLKERLGVFKVNSDGNKKLLQVRLTLAELGLRQTDKETEDLLIKWFHHQKPELKAVCEDQDVPSDGTIAQMRRALVWDLAERGLLDKEAAEDSIEEEPTPKPSKLTKKKKKLAKFAELMLRLDSEDSAGEEEPAPKPSKLTKKTKKKLAKFAELILRLDSEDSAEEEPTPKLPTITTTKRKVTNVPRRPTSSEDSSEEDLPARSKNQSLRKEPPLKLKGRAKAGSHKNRPNRFVGSLQKELDALR